MDTYVDGDRYGHRIDIRFDGRYVLYRRFIQQRKGNDPSIREELIEEGKLETNVLSALRSTVDWPELSSIPKRLPNVDPRRVEIREPAETVILRVRPTPSDELVEIRANMGADRKHYPPTFLELHTHLKRLIRELQDEKSR